MIKHFSLTLLIIFLVLFRASAFDIDWFTDYRGLSSGHTTCNFLTLPLSSNVLARGLASTPGAMDATDLPLFSANSALSNRNKFAIHHLEWLMGLRKEYAGALFPVQDIGTFGFYSQLFSPGKIENARDIDEQPSSPSLVELAIGTTFARSFINKTINIGLSLSYIESRLDHEAGRALSGSIDLLFTPVKQFSSRFYLANFGTGVSYGKTSEPLPLQGGISLQFFPLPSYIPFTSKFNFDIGAGVRKIADEPVVTGISTGIKAGQYFNFFTGYEFSYGLKPSISGFGIGGGFHHNIYGLELAWKNLSDELGSVWSATMKIQLEEKKQRSAEDYYTIAEKFYKMNRRNSCRNFAKKALKLDPNMWKAHVLLNRLKSEELRSKKQEIALIYTGSLKNQFLPPPYAGSLGGIARQATAIYSLRNQFPVSFTIQTGNTITASANKLRINLAAFYLQKIKFDAICAGDGELSWGIKKLSESGFPEKLISSNNKATSQVIPYTILKNGGYKLYVASFTNPILVPHEKSVPLKDFEPDDLFSSEAASCDLRILIMHDNWQNISLFAKRLQKFDIIICGNLNQYFAAPMKIGKTFVLSAGDAGKYLGNLIMRFDENKRLVRIDNVLIPLSSEIIADSAINVAAEMIGAKIDLQDQGNNNQGVKKASTDGVFTFISNRDDEYGIYLKLIGRNAEFPLTREYGNCEKPVFSNAAGKISYIITSDDGCNRLELIDLTGAKRRLVVDSSTHIEAAFTPDGKWIYYTAANCNKNQSSDIYRTPCEGGPSYKIITWNESAEHSISFSNNNEYMLFCSNKDGKDQIYLSNPAGEHPLKITDVQANNYKPEFSPDDRYIGYLSDRSNFGGKLDLWVYDRINATHNQITQNSNVKSFCWLSDSKSIIYSSGTNLLDLTKVDITAHRYSKLNNNIAIKTFSEKNPKIIFIDGEETVIYEREFGDGEKQIFGTKPDGTGERCIVDSKGTDWFGW